MKEHIKILDFLRGFAALAVVLFHFGDAALPTLKQNYLSNIVVYGKYGVQIFFVISGFVIPYSMMKSKYMISDYFNNLLRRFVRINPPSYVAILLSFILYYSSIIIINRPISGMDWPGVNLTAILANLSYSVPIFDTTWYNPVFWTLSIEFQFYIIIGLLLPLIKTKNNTLTSLSLIGILSLGFLDLEWFFDYGSFFVLGILLFLKREQLIHKNLIILLFFITITFCYFQNGLVELIFGLLAFLAISSKFNLNYKVTNLLGKISYSLYITHWAVGSISEIVLKRITNLHEYPFGKIIMILIYTSIAICFAYLFYKYIEQPFIQYSKAIKSNKK